MTNLMKECLSHWYIISFYINNFHLYNKSHWSESSFALNFEKKSRYTYGWISTVTQESVE